MQHNFDDTFDALLHRAAARRAGSDVLPERHEHLDAQSISAFVENALPDTTRVRFAAHLADCSDCRQILVNFASIQEAEAVEVAETIPAAPKTRPSWFADWFTLPNLAYAAAALTILFIGVFGFVAFRAKQETITPTVALVETEETEAKREERRRAARAPEPTPEPTPQPTPEVQIDVPANSAADNANSAQNLNQNVPEQSPNRGLPPSVVATRGGQGNAAETASPRREPEAAAPRETPRSSATQQQSQTLAAANTSATGNPVGSATPTPMRAANPPADATAVFGAANSANSNRTGDAQSNQAEAPALANQNRTERAAPTSRSLAVKTVGGKTFQKLAGVWRDAAYNGQTIVNVGRGTNEFKKLENNLRSIANGFASETVIVVWQGKAYRIR